MTSRERILAAITGATPDHVPLMFMTFCFRPPAHLTWHSHQEQSERWLSLGVDVIAQPEVYLPTWYPPGVQVRAWTEQPADARYPVMVKEYETPAGTLRQEVYRTGETGPWPEPEEAQPFDDYNVPRYRRPLVRGEADLPALRYLLQTPEGEALAAFREGVQRDREACDRLGVLLSGWGPAGTDAAVWLGGVENLILLAMDQPGVFAELLDLIHTRDKRLVEIMLDTPIELIVRRGWYDHSDFWSPALYRTHIAPRLQELTDLVHQGGRLMGYSMSTALAPFLEMLTEIGYDLHYHIDPVQGKADLRQVKATLGRRTCLLGGMNSAVTLERGSDAEIRRAAQEAVAALAPGGRFILSPVDCLSPTTPWHSVEVLIDAWREFREVY